MAVDINCFSFLSLNLSKSNEGVLKSGIFFHIFGKGPFGLGILLVFRSRLGNKTKENVSNLLQRVS